MKGNYPDDRKGREHPESLNVWQLNWTVILLRRWNQNIYQIGWSYLVYLFTVTYFCTVKLVWLEYHRHSNWFFFAIHSLSNKPWFLEQAKSHYNTSVQITFSNSNCILNFIRVTRFIKIKICWFSKINILVYRIIKTSYWLFYNGVKKEKNC